MFVFFTIGCCLFLHIPSSASTKFDGPIFSSYFPQTITHLDHQRVNISCTAQGNPPPSTIWVNSDTHHRLETLPGIMELTDSVITYLPYREHQLGVSDVNRRVRCVASNVHGSIVSTEIYFRPVIMDHHKSFRVEISNIDSYSGGTVVLSCSIFPQHVTEFVTMVSWTANDLPIVEDERHKQLSNDLHISDLSPKDSTTAYRCLGRHTLTGITRISSPKMLTVKATPLSPPIMISFPNVVKVKEGEHVVLPCAANGIPSINYIWKWVGPTSSNRTITEEIINSTSGRLRMNGHYVTIISVRSQDSGVYVCVADNSLGKAEHVVKLVVTSSLIAFLEPQLQHFNLSQSVTFKCITLTSDLVDLVTWYHNGRRIDARSYDNGSMKYLISDKDRTLTVLNAAFKDVGMYQCFVGGSDGMVQASAQLKLGALPAEILSGFDTQYTQAGPNVTLTCLTIGIPTPEVVWIHDEVLITADDSKKSMMTFPLHNASLSIELILSRITLTDGGLYTCIVSNRFGSARHQARLEVYGIPTIRDMNNITAVTGSTAILHCHVIGYPVHKVTWRKDNVILLPTNHRQMIATNNSLIIISTDKIQDSGTYTCDARDSNGAGAERSSYLQIIDAPKIDPFHLSRKKLKDRLSMSCALSEGDLPMLIYWMKDGWNITDGGVTVQMISSYTSLLSIEQLTRSHAGNYTCIASNQAGHDSYTAELNVDVPPFWLVHPNIDEEAIVGDRLVLSCVTSGVPQPVVTWSRSLTNHVDIKVENVSTGYGRISLLSNGSLSINDVQKSDEGYFVCKSSNGVGPDVSRIISVHVHSPARFVSEGDKEENMMIGRDMTMTCNATGDHPTSIAWNKDKRNLDWMDGGRFKMTFFNLKDNIRSSALEISSLQRKDNGWYYCIAKNKYGSHVIKNLLRVLEPPDPPFDLKLLASGSRHARIGFKNGYNGNDAILGHYINIVGGEENGDLGSREILINSSNFGDQWTEVMTFHIDRLLPGVRYEINIKSMNSIGVGTWSDVLRIETQEEVPSSSPEDVRVVAMDSQSLNISWKPPSKNSNGIILGYHVGLKRGNEPFIFYSFKSISFCLLENLSKFSEYFVIVQAFNSKGVGPKSHPVKVVTNEDFPSDSPTDIKIQAIDSQTIHISWRPPTSINGILMGYDVIYEETNSPDDSKTTRTTNRNNMTINGLKKYNNYTFLVRAFTAVGRGVSSRPLIVSTLEDVAGVPTNLKVLPSSLGEMSVYWQPPLERNGIIIGYVVDVCQINNENISNEFLYPSSTLNCILSNLTLHIEVRVTVKALTSIGVGPDTEPVIARVLDTAQARVVESSKSILIDSKVPITLPCTAVGQPLPSKTWRINGNNLNVKDCCFINLDGSLTIELPDETTGNYECVVENMHGKDQVEYVVSAENLPSPLKLISKQFDSLQFQWSNNYFIKSKEYLLQYRPCIENDESGNDFRDEDWITFNLTTERNFTIKNLDCGKEYEIQIRDHKMKKSIDINKYNTTGDSPIMPVQSLLIHEINSSSISLNLSMWLDGGCPISRYKVEYQTNINDYWLLMKDNVSGDQEYLQLDLHPDTWYRIRVNAFNSAGRTECILNFATPPLQMTNDSLDGSHAARLTKLKIQRHVPLYDRMEFMLPITTAIMFTMVTATILILRRKRKIIDKRCQQNNLSSLLQSDYQPSKHEIETINFRNIDSELYASRISEVESKTENRTGNIIYKKLHLGSRLKTNPTEIRRNKKSKKKRVYPSRPPRTSTPKQSETLNLHKFHANEQEKHVDLDFF